MSPPSGETWLKNWSRTIRAENPSDASLSCPWIASGLSPRLVPIPVFNPDTYDKGRGSGRQDIEIVKLVGFFIMPLDGNDVVGYLMDFPTAPKAGPPAPRGATFLISIALVR